MLWEEEHMATIVLTEPFALQDILISGIADVEEFSPDLFRLTCFCKRRSLALQREERAAVVQLVAIGDDIETIAAILSKAVARSRQHKDH